MDSPIKYPGGKSGYLAKWIIPLMPPRVKDSNKQDPSDKGWCHYVEPYFGAGGVLFRQDPEGISEVVNDMNRDLITFWKVLQNPLTFDQFKRIIEAVPFSGEEWDSARKTLEANNPMVVSEVITAVLFFIYVRQSLAGRMTSFSGITRTRTRSGMNAEASAWWNCIEGLAEVRDRLKRVVILTPRPAIQVLRDEDGPTTLFYLDPPYLLRTRKGGDQYKRFEMSESDHRVLVSVVNELKGKVMLSGYRSDMYDLFLKAPKWTRHEEEIDNKAAGGKEKRDMIECLWCNF